MHASTSGTLHEWLLATVKEQGLDSLLFNLDDFGFHYLPETIKN